jgi:hypothetical protein
MMVLEAAAAPLDRLRGPTLRLLSQIPVLRNVLSRRDSRIAVLGAAQVLLLFGITLRWPIALYFLGPVVFGVVHLAADVRYLVFRFTLPRALLRASLTLAAALTAVRLCVGLHVANPTLGARIDIALGAGWVGLALVLRLRESPRARAWLLPIFAASAVFMVVHAPSFDLVLTHLHNLTAFVLWLGLFRQRWRWALVPMFLVAIAAAILLSGVCLPWTFQQGGLAAFGQRAEFSTDCTNTASDPGCALTLVGNLDARSKWSGGSLAMGLSIDHADAWESYSCGGS